MPAVDGDWSAVLAGQAVSAWEEGASGADCHATSGAGHVG